jgi:hypothetical protein
MIETSVALLFLVTLSITLGFTSIYICIVRIENQLFEFNSFLTTLKGRK